MDDSMATQENVALAWSLIDLCNCRQSDPAWLDKSMVAFAADTEIFDVPSGAILRGPDSHKRFMLFFVENFPDVKIELINACAIEDRAVLERTSWWYDSGRLPLPWGARPIMWRSG